MSEYFSSVVCAGGCGNLMPQHLVDRGWAYLYGHKTGCPAEGEPVGKKAVKIKSAREVSPTRPGPVEHTSYERTLSMTVENLRAASVELANADAAVNLATARVAEAHRQFDAVARLAEALLAVVPATCSEALRARDLMVAIGVGPEQAVSA